MLVDKLIFRHGGTHKHINICVRGVAKRQIVFNNAVLQKHLFCLIGKKFAEFVKEKNVGRITVYMRADPVFCQNKAQVVFKTAVGNDRAERSHLFAVGRMVRNNIDRIDFGVLAAQIFEKVIAVITRFRAAFGHDPQVAICRLFSEKKACRFGGNHFQKHTNICKEPF